MFVKLPLNENPDSFTSINTDAIEEVRVADDGSATTLYLISGRSMIVATDVSDKLGIGTIDSYVSEVKEAREELDEE